MYLIFQLSEEECMVLCDDMVDFVDLVTYTLQVMQTNFSFPTIGDSTIITEARADLTCWLASVASDWIQGIR